MSVFLRWGIFGILGFAGLMYAYNASKQMAAKRAARVAPAAVETAQPVEPRPEVQAAPAPALPPGLAIQFQPAASTSLASGLFSLAAQSAGCG